MSILEKQKLNYLLDRILRELYPSRQILTNLKKFISELPY